MEEERSNREFCTRRPFTVKVAYTITVHHVIRDRSSMGKVILSVTT